VTWIISELVENYSAHPQYVDNLDWYFMPVVNPDGYEFTHTNVNASHAQIELFLKYRFFQMKLSLMILLVND